LSPTAVEKIKIVGAVLALPIQLILPHFLINGPNWHFRLAPKRPFRILIFSIAVGVQYSLYVKSIAT
jgi:hypothetical protein